MSLSFDLSTSDPEFIGLVRDSDQLPGRPTEGRIEIASFFNHILLYSTAEQKAGPVNGSTIFQELWREECHVLGPNVGQYLYENQGLIPEKLQGRVVLAFWGKVYRLPEDRPFIRCLSWYGRRWLWDSYGINRDHWNVFERAVVLAKKS